MFVIVGLGNPGREYAKTRHNVGFMTINKIAERLNISVNKKGFRSVYGEGRLGGTRVVLAKPETFMNNSGWAVGDLLKWYKPQHDELIVIYDDIDLPCGALRIRMNGSAGTHNGMRSIESLIGFEDFPRIRVGIGKPAHGLIDHVLGVPNDEEAKLIDGAMMQAAEELISEGFMPTRDIYFVSTCTEETTGEGALSIVQELTDRHIHFEAVFDEGGMILYDPIGGAKGTFAMIGVGEKNCCDLRFIARSKGGHAAAPGKNTPLVRLGKFMAEVDGSAPFKKKINPVVAEMMRRIAPYMGPVGFVLKHPELFGRLIRFALPRISDTAGAMLRTTLAFTMAKGSGGINVIPDEAYVIGNMRTAFHQDVHASIAAIKPIAQKHGIEIEVLDVGVSSGVSDYNSNGFRQIEKALKAAWPSVDRAVPYIMTGASDSRYFDNISDNCFRFLPFLIDEQQLNSIHGVNENVDLSTLAPAVHYYRILMQEVSS